MQVLYDLAPLSIVFRRFFLNVFLCVSLNCPHAFLLVSFSCWLSSLYPCMVWTSRVYVFRMHTMCLHTWQTLQLWPLRKILLNVSMEASTFSLSGMLAYSKDYTLEVKEYRTLSKLLKLSMGRGACSSGHLCRGGSAWPFHESCLQLWPCMVCMWHSLQRGVLDSMP